MKPKIHKMMVKIRLSLYGLAICLQVASAEPTPLAPEQLIDALQQGGLVIYVRHATTDHTQDDEHPVDLSDCATQRNLSRSGRQQARRIGEAIKRLAIPIGEVLSSPFCRCYETAQLLFGRYRLDEDLYYAVAVDKATRTRQRERLRKLLSTPPGTGLNKVIVSHTGNLREATGIWPKPEGVAWVFRPLGEGRFEALGGIDPGDWPNPH
jgi:phosphohistidine phosphatase SixA